MQQKILLWISLGLFIACFMITPNGVIHAAESPQKKVGKATDGVVKNKEKQSDAERIAITSSSSLYQIYLQPLDRESGIKISVSPAGRQDARIRLPRIATFIQQPYLWVVISESVIHDFSSIKNLSEGFSIPEVIKNSGGFVMRLKIPSSATPSVEHDPSGKWILSLGTQKPKRPFGTLPFLTGKLFAFLKPPAALMINLKNVVPVQITDPESQAQFIVVPTAEAGVGFPSVFRYADFKLLETFQGLAFEPFSPGITLQVEEFLKLSQKEGLNLSPAEDRQGAKKTREDLSFFAFKEWQMSHLEKASARKQLEDKILHAPPEDRFKEQLALVQFLVSHGQGAEALGILRLISEKNPRLNEDAEYLALFGISLFLNQDMTKALQTLSNPSLPSEVELWRGAVLIKLGFVKDGLSMMMNQLSTLMRYPQPILPELALVAADGCIQSQDRSNTEKFFSLLKDAPLSSAQSSYLANLKEQLVILNMDPELRESLAVQLQTKGKGHNSLAKEGFSKLIMQLEQKKITPEKAIKQLEALRLSWRGDDLEFAVLHKLGQLYAAQKNYGKALESFDRAIRFFPNFPDKGALQNEATQLFQEGLFHASPLQKISFFYEFKNFLPKGEKGIDIVKKLAQEFLDLDLPDQSILILKKELKSNNPPPLLVRLAEAYIKDKKPLKALEILDSPVLKEDTQNQGELQYLRALSYYDLGQFEKALAALKENQMPQAQALRTKIQWELKDWKNMAQGLKEGIDRSEKIDSKTLVQLAMALFQAGDLEGLQEIKGKYLSVITDPVQKKVFLLLTQSSYEEGLNIQKIKESLFQASDFKDFSDILKQEIAPQ